MKNFLIKIDGYIYELSDQGSDKGMWTVFTDTHNEIITAFYKPIKAQWDYGSNGKYNFRVIASDNNSLGLPELNKND